MVSDDLSKLFKPSRGCVGLLPLLICVSGLVLALLSLAPAANAAAQASRVRIGAAPERPAGSTVVGALAGSAQLSLAVTLSPRDPAALAAYATAVSTPGSSDYRNYLTVAEFRRRFGPGASAVAAVRAALVADGLRPGPTSANGLLIPVSASAASVAQAFSVSLQRVHLRSGREAYANSQAPQFSASVAATIQGVVGLNTLAEAQPLGLTRAPAVRFGLGPGLTLDPVVSSGSVSPQVVTGGPQPCSTAVSDAPGNDSYTADQIASAYQFSSLYSDSDLGAGQTVALFELEPNLRSDISAYQSCYGTDTTVNYIHEDGGAGNGAGSGEAALDIEDVLGFAPSATIDVYQAPRTDAGVIYNYTAMVDSSPRVNVISTSWGECETDEAGTGLAAAENTLFQQAATQGQSVFAAAGDSGSQDCQNGSLAVDDPGTQPDVTSVGGTSLSALGPPPVESVWNDQCEGSSGPVPCGGGGGVSSVWPMPSYQSNAASSLHVINAESSGTPCSAGTGNYCREVPDVSADADPGTGYLIDFGGTWIGIGGTSAAAPLWAAFTALVNASSYCAGTGIGFANAALYKAATAEYSTTFDDITSGNNDITGTNDGLYEASSGYDMASGLGSPIGSELPQALCGGDSVVTVANPGSQTTMLNSATSLQISATDSRSETLTYSASGLPTGLSISSSGLISGTLTFAGSYTVTVTARDTDGNTGSATFNWTVGGRSTSTALSCSRTTLIPGANTTCTATVTDTDSGTAVTPTGEVSFQVTPSTDGSFSSGGACGLSATAPGQASCTLTYAPAANTSGSQPVIATYNGDGGHSPSSSSSFELTVPAAPTATISTPPSDQTFTIGESVATAFACTEGAGGPGLSSCRDSNGANGHGKLNTATAGSHTYTVIATSGDGLTGAVGLSYQVTAGGASGGTGAKPANIASPIVSGTAGAGRILSCDTGSWSNSPVSYSYQWYRNGTAIVGATSATYNVTSIDEGSALTCDVTATNTAGEGAPAASAGVAVAVPRISGCPAATGSVRGTRLGLLVLGMTRRQARRSYAHSSRATHRAEDFFCLTPSGIRVGYATKGILQILPKARRSALAGRIIWISTGNPRYALDGIAPGATLGAAEHALPHGTLIIAGAARWYLSAAGRARGLFEARAGVIQRIGIANLRLTPNARTDRRLITQFG